MTREACPEIRVSTGELCDYVAGHPPAAHCTFRNGWPWQWSNPPKEPWRNVALPHDNSDAPASLR